MDERRHRIFPSVRYADASSGIAWLEAALGAVALLVVPGPADTIAHAEIKLGGSVFFVGTAHHQTPEDRPEQRPGSSAVYVLVDDVDEVYAQALAAGGIAVRAPSDSEVSGRGATVRDPEGNLWSLGVYRPSSF